MLFNFETHLFISGAAYDEEDDDGEENDLVAGCSRGMTLTFRFGIELAVLLSPSAAAERSRELDVA